MAPITLLHAGESHMTADKLLLELGWHRLLALVPSPLWQRQSPDAESSATAISYGSHVSRADISHWERAQWEEMISLGFCNAVSLQ